MDPHRFLRVGAASVGVQAWRYRGRDQLAIVAKVSFAFPTDPAALKGARTVLETCDPEPLSNRDVSHDDHPARSLADCTDMSPFLPRGEAVLIGSAYVPRGDRVAVRFAIARSGAMIFDRRVWATAPQGPDAVSRIPLVYESAIGGAGNHDNPVGSDRPILVDARDAKAPGAFGPLLSFWRARGSLIQPDDRRGLKGAVFALRDDFPWEYFQAAPASQRAPGFFAGDETLLLDHVSPSAPRLELSLPGVQVAARIHDGRLGEPFPLVADFLRIEPDRGKVSLTFRASVPHVPGKPITIGTRVSIRGRPDPDWPEEKQWAAAPPPPSKRGKPKTEAMRLDGPAPASLPFDGSRPSAKGKRVAAPVPGAPFGSPAAPAPAVAPAGLGMTLDLDTGPRAPASPPVPKFGAVTLPAPPHPSPAPTPARAPAPAPAPPPARPIAPPPLAVPWAVPAPTPALSSTPAPARAPARAPLKAPPGLAAFGLVPLGASAPTDKATPIASRSEPTLGAELLRAVLERRPERSP